MNLQQFVGKQLEQADGALYELMEEYPCAPEMRKAIWRIRRLVISADHAVGFGLKAGFSWLEEFPE